MPSQNTSEEEGLPLRPRVRLPGETLELATPISQHPLVPSKEGSGKAETTNFQNDTQLVPRVLPKTSACQLLGWLLLPLLGPRLGGGLAPPRSPGTLGCPWAGGRGAPAVCSLNGLYKPCPPTGRRLLSDSSKGIFTRQSLWLKTFLSPLLLF